MSDIEDNEEYENEMVDNEEDYVNNPEEEDK